MDSTSPESGDVVMDDRSATHSGDLMDVDGYQSTLSSGSEVSPSEKSEDEKNVFSYNYISPLLRLPKKIRRKIYRFFCIWSRPIGEPSFQKVVRMMPILLVSSQIRKEAWRVFCSENIFVINPLLNPDHLSPSGVISQWSFNVPTMKFGKYIKRLHIYLPTGPMSDAVVGIPDLRLCGFRILKEVMFIDRRRRPREEYNRNFLHCIRQYEGLEDMRIETWGCYFNKDFGQFTRELIRKRIRHVPAKREEDEEQRREAAMKKLSQPEIVAPFHDVMLDGGTF